MEARNGMENKSPGSGIINGHELLDMDARI